VSYPRKDVSGQMLLCLEGVKKLGVNKSVKLEIPSVRLQWIGSFDVQFVLNKGSFKNYLANIPWWLAWASLAT